MSYQEIEIEGERYSLENEEEYEYYDENSSEIQEVNKNPLISQLAFNNSSQIIKCSFMEILQDTKYKVSQISKELGISQGRAFFLLRVHNYNKDNCETIPSHILDDIYTSEDEILNSLKSSNFCLMCVQPFEQEESYSFECKHQFCKECFNNSLKISLQESNVLELTCQIEGCKERISIQDAQNYFNNEDSRICFEEIMLSDILSLSKNLIKCPNSNCNLFFDISNVGNNDNISLNLQCSCRSDIFCSNCRCTAHQPINCEMVQSFLSIIQLYNNKECDENITSNSLIIEQYIQYSCSLGLLSEDREKILEYLTYKLSYYHKNKAITDNQIALYKQSFDILIEGTKYLQNLLIKIFFQGNHSEQIFECIYYELEIQLKKFQEFLINDVKVNLQRSAKDFNSFFEIYNIELLNQSEFLKNYLTKLSLQQ